MALTGQSKNTATFQRYAKSGAGWTYDQSDITYDMVEDVHGRPVTYDGLGTAVTFSGQTKTAAITPTTLTKNTI